MNAPQPPAAPRRAASEQLLYCTPPPPPEPVPAAPAVGDTAPWFTSVV